VGLILATATILFGQVLGIIFGLNEDMIKGHLQRSAAEVRETVYRGDDAVMKAVQEKSWTYMKRAHLHAGAMGTTALALIVMVALLGPSSSRVTGAIGMALGGGGLGYSVFWMLAGLLAPGLGGTGAAKESLRWLAVPCSGAYVLGTVAVMLLLIMTLSVSGESAARAEVSHR
jgi:hypothetical protein